MVTFGARTFTWEHGRQLASQTVNGSTWTYTYNADGMRTGRTNGTNTYEYIYNGSQLMQMTRNGVVVNFTYINGIPATISYDGMIFYYVVNGQGDITGITDSSGNVQVRYYYDAWGVSTSVYSDDAVYGLSLATINPLRYRGYVYDWEVGLYYLQSRYYIPEIGRFVNADAYGSTGQGILGNNMFGYCGNNPVNNIDPSGYWWITAVVSAVVNVATTYVAAKVMGQEYTWVDAVVAAGVGALNAIPVVGSYISGAVSGIYAGYSAYANGASLGEAVLCGAVSGYCTTASISNLANSQGAPLLSVGTAAACDVTFGTGYNIISAATSKAVVDKSSQTSNNPIATTTNRSTKQNTNNSAATIVKRTTSNSNTRIVGGQVVAISSKNWQYVDPNDRNKVYCYVQF